MKTRNLLTGGASLALGGFVCTVLAFAQLPQTQQTTGGRSALTFSPRGCANAWAREPVLIYDSTGSTLIGPSHLQLSVYSDGLATFSRIDPTDPGSADVMVRSLPVEIVQELSSSLKVVNGEGICDDPLQVSDVPMVTVTVFSLADTDASSHTFSYYQAPSGVTAVVETVVQNFIAAQFVGHR